LLLPTRKDFKPKRRAIRCIPLLMLGFLSALTAPRALGIRDCPGIGAVSDYKIAMDEVTPPTTGATPTPTDIQRLAAELQTQMEEIAVEEGGAIVAVPCAGRRPASETDFSRLVVESLNDNNVVLEIWGSFEPSANPTTSGPNARLQFVLIPVRYYEHFVNSSQTMGGVYLILYTPAGSGTALALFEKSSELRASVALGMALKKIKEGRNALAMKYLCKAETSLKQQNSRIPKPKRDALLQYARDLEVLALTANNKTASLLTEEAKANICAPPVR
jgi:hypothetical protein